MYANLSSTSNGARSALRDEFYVCPQRFRFVQVIERWPLPLELKTYRSDPDLSHDHRSHSKSQVDSSPPNRSRTPIPNTGEVVRAVSGGVRLLSNE